MIDTSKIEPGNVYIAYGHLWQKCTNCWKVIRVDSWHGGIHLCS